MDSPNNKLGQKASVAVRLWHLNGTKWNAINKYLPQSVTVSGQRWRRHGKFGVGVGIQCKYSGVSNVLAACQRASERARLQSDLRSRYYFHCNSTAGSSMIIWKLLLAIFDMVGSEKGAKESDREGMGKLIVCDICFVIMVHATPPVHKDICIVIYYIVWIVWLLIHWSTDSLVVATAISCGRMAKRFHSFMIIETSPAVQTSTIYFNLVLRQKASHFGERFRAARK